MPNKRHILALAILLALPVAAQQQYGQVKTADLQASNEKLVECQLHLGNCVLNVRLSDLAQFNPQDGVEVMLAEQFGIGQSVSKVYSYAKSFYDARTRRGSFEKGESVHIPFEKLGQALYGEKTVVLSVSSSDRAALITYGTPAR